eukprot:CAMPEP_0119133946 /NCGR_PEP_ID=MMETSP1310-20130426/14697_1 /TAXON_ID=464262 /ORGANISM="Genus nov. species nov., Strain RCC2339" /LENGTH=60 /DNA_ID=CAMNT_0007124681 /DNA_START=79 /DNA_END=256 /DNA_ORIENTATION=+
MRGRPGAADRGRRRLEMNRPGDDEAGTSALYAASRPEEVRPEEALVVGDPRVDAGQVPAP